MDRNVLQECLRGSFDGTMSFPEVVSKLQATGVSRYEVDLVTREKRDYGSNNVVEREPLPINWPVDIADGFSADGVKSALVEIQQKRITYPEFLRRIMAAGTASYAVFIHGRKTIYTGRDGDFYVELFPDQL